MSEFFELSGFTVVTGASCREARAIAQTQHADLFILDRNLPDGDGLSLAGYLRSSCDASVIIRGVRAVRPA